MKSGPITKRDVPHAIITGGSSGIGLAVASRLLADDWCVSLIARSAAKLESAKEKLEQSVSNISKSVALYSADVTSPTEIGAAVAAAIAEHGAPELLVASAGIAKPGYFDELSVETFDEVMAVNFLGSVNVIKAVLPSMQQQNRGHVVLISSGAGLLGIFGYTAYSASKFAVRGFAESLRAELRPHGIGVSIVYPPDTDTPQLELENATKPIETSAIAKTAKVRTPDFVADCIVKGVAKGHFRITPGLEMHALGLFHSLLAPLLFRIMDRIVRKARNTRR